MQPIDLVLFVDDIANELDLACALKYLAWQRFGMCIAVASLRDNLSTTLQQWKPRAVAVPSFSSRQDPELREILAHWSEVRILNLELVQGAISDDDNIRLPRDQFSRAHALHLASSDHCRDLLLSNGVPADRISVTGSLVCGLYQEPYRNLFAVQRRQLAEKHALDPHRPWALVTIHESQAMFKTTDRHNAQTLDSRVLHEVARWCRVGAESGQCEIIVRPARHATADRLQQAFWATLGELPIQRLHLVHDESPRQWVLACDTVLATHTSPLIEAAVADRPAYLLSPEFLAPHEVDTLHSLPSCIRTCDEFATLVRRGPSPFATSLLRQWAHRELLGHGDPLSAAVAVMASVVGGSHRVPPAPALPVIDRLQMRLRKSPFAWRKPENQRRRPSVIGGVDSHRPFTASDVERRIAAWQSVLDLPPRRARAA